MQWTDKEDYLSGAPLGPDEMVRGQSHNKWMKVIALAIAFVLIIGLTSIIGAR